jgi:hypothetical protein
VSDPPQPLRRGAFAFTLAAIGVALFGGVAWRQLGRSDEDRAAIAFRAARYCLLGDDQGSAQRSLRARAVAIDLDPSIGDWPVRCAGPLDGLRSRLDGMLLERRQRCDSRECCGDDPRCGELARLRDEVDKAVAFARYGTDFDPTDFEAFGRELGYAGAPLDGAPEPIAPAPLLDPSQMAPLYEGDYLRLLTDPDGDRGIELLFYEQDERYGWCTLELDGTSPARCRDLAGQVPVGLAGELLAGEDGAPRRMYAQGPEGEGWRHALFDVATGRALRTVAYRPQGGFVWRDGSFAWIGFEPPMQSLSLFRHDVSAAEPAPVPLAMAALSASPRLYHDEMMWAEPQGGDEGQTAPTRHRLLTRRLARDELGPPVEIAEIEGAKPPALELCRTQDLLAILALTEHGDQGARGVILLRGSDWHPPHPVHVGSARFGFTCQGETATLSWIVGRDEIADEPPGSWDDREESPVKGRYEVHRLRCDARGCDHDEVTLPLRRFGKSSRYVAGDLGQATVVMYRSPLGDVRMRVAPLAELPEARDVPLFDDPEHDGFGWDLERDPIFGRAGGMVVLVSRQIESREDTAVFAFRVDGRGVVTPVDVAPVTTPHVAPGTQFSAPSSPP